MAAAAAAYPPWVVLEQYCTKEADGCSSTGDTKTTARGHTTNGHPIAVSLCLAAPPEGSRVCVQLPAGVQALAPVVVAAHGDSVLLQVMTRDVPTRSIPTDHFVYSAGDAAAEPPRPPSLWLLPPHTITYEEEDNRLGCRYLDTDSTGLLLRGDGDFVVVELKMEYVVRERKEATLHLLRSAHCTEWRVVKRPAISRCDAAGGGEPVDVGDMVASAWRSDTVFPVSDRMLVWVDMARGLLFSDLFDDDESPSLRYVPLPAEAPYLGRSKACRNVCATADGRTIKFVNVFARCCCGGAANCSCRASHHAYTVQTWTLRMDDHDMTWAMDGSLGATQLWALDGYRGLPRVELDHPVVSMDEPETICFEVCEKWHENHGDDTMWRIMVDMKSKTLRSVFRYPKEQGCWRRPLSSRVSKYFNSIPSSGQPPGPVAQAEAMLNLSSNRRVNNKLLAINNNMQAASPVATILAALQEIPGLDHDDMLKAYRILTYDDSGRRFRSLMGLPLDLRKDWVLIEIKASEACVLCSSCSADLQIKE